MTASLTINFEDEDLRQAFCQWILSSPRVTRPDQMGFTEERRCAELPGDYELLTAKRSVTQAEVIEPHLCSKVRCKNCGHKWVAVSPAFAPIEKLQCPRCMVQNAEFSS